MAKRHTHRRQRPEEVIRCEICRIVLIEPMTNICSACGIVVCDQHTTVCDDCESVFCTRHTNLCDECDDDICGDCADDHLEAHEEDDEEDEEEEEEEEDEEDEDEDVYYKVTKEGCPICGSHCIFGESDDDSTYEFNKGFVAFCGHCHVYRWISNDSVSMKKLTKKDFEKKLEEERCKDKKKSRVDAVIEDIKEGRRDLPNSPP